MSFWHDETGQDLTEYTLVVAFIVLSSLALLIMNTAAVSSIWGTATSVVNQGYERAQSGRN